tara:strand:- start:6345 stop:6932 length:588 start_codon:yes stop_codon:yes gene_type:complete
MFLLVDSKNIYKNTWGSKAVPINDINDPNGENITYKQGNVTFEAVTTNTSTERTYKYKIDLNEEIRNADSIRLVDYSISMPPGIEMKQDPSFILKVNNYELVTHHQYKYIFKSIPFSKLCEHDVKNAKYFFDNSDNVIRSIEIQICKLMKDDLTGQCELFEELDDGSPTGENTYHNSFLFEIIQNNYGESFNRRR